MDSSELWRAQREDVTQLLVRGGGACAATTVGSTVYYTTSQ